MYVSLLKSNITYSINVKVLEEFNLEVKDQTRSRLIEALMIKFLIDYSKSKKEKLKEQKQ